MLWLPLSSPAKAYPGPPVVAHEEEEIMKKLEIPVGFTTTKQLVMTSKFQGLNLMLSTIDLQELPFSSTRQQSLPSSAHLLLLPYCKASFYHGLKPANLANFLKLQSVQAMPVTLD
ncbi:hypothetical protein R1flu_006327 [Riccia fluitans]|uniref:Uncharacterized protein n=1 Tax=Riccia fluitans TaxID=41844 RepID=A0ABD1YVP4_9MARC